MGFLLPFSRAEPVENHPASSPGIVHAEAAETGEEPHAETAEVAEAGEEPRAVVAEAVSTGETRESQTRKKEDTVINRVPKDAQKLSKPHVRATVTLSDGSVLRGTLRRRFLPVVSDTLGRIRLDLSSVKSITFNAFKAKGFSRLSDDSPPVTSQTAAHIEFRNGDRLTVSFPDNLRTIPFNTLLGPVHLPLDKTTSIVLVVSPSASSSVTPPPSLLYHCTFDDQSSIEHPAAGPAGTFLDGAFLPGKIGNALHVEANTTAFEALLPKGFLGPEGCLEFWAKIEGDNPHYFIGGDPLFVSLYDERGYITLLQFAENNGFGRGGLGGAMACWPFGSISHGARSMGYAEVLGGDWSGWHHYAMSWKASGFGDGSFVKVFVDGRSQPVLGGVDDDKVPARLADFGDHAYQFGIPWHTARADHRRSNKPFLIDDLKIWSTPKTDFALPVLNPVPKLLYHCTFDDEASIEHPAVGPAGRFLDGDFVQGKVGAALRTFADEPAAEVNFKPGTLGSRGTIEFWAKLEKQDDMLSSFLRGNLRFFGLWLHEQGETPPWCSTHLQFTPNDGGGMSGLCGMVNHCSWATNPSFGGNPYSPIQDDLTGWHHYAVIWDANGLPGTKAEDGGQAVVDLYLDGKPLSTKGRKNLSRGHYLTDIAERFAKLAFPTPSNGWNSSAGHIPFCIDEFKIWSAPKTDFDLPAPLPEPLPPSPAAINDSIVIHGFETVSPLAGASSPSSTSTDIRSP